jgi:GNAT superfamily N-acetyltransferase
MQGQSESIVFRVATPSRWKDVLTLFGERGACGGCWCMAWRLRPKQWESGKGAGNRRAFRRIVTSGQRPGVLAYDGRQPVGWCAVAPREVYGALARSRVMAPVDDQPVWSVSCLFVLRPYRRQGLSTRLLHAAADHAARAGARIVEGYPVQPRQDRAPDAFLWTGTPSAFERAGFCQVLRRSETRPIMRKHVGVAR